MNEATLTRIVIMGAAALIALLLRIVWAGARAWIVSMDSLKTSVDGLKFSITELKNEFVTREKHEADLATLRRETGVFGRRRLDHCMNPECPFEQPRMDEEI